MKKPQPQEFLWLLALFGAWIALTHGHPSAAGGSLPAGYPAPAAPLPALSWARWADAVWRLVGALLALLVVLGAGLTLSRLWFRRRRLLAMEVDEIILGPDDTAQPVEIIAALDAIHGQIQTRYGGNALGQVSWTFETVREAGQVHFLLAAPHGWLSGIEDVWRSKYTNIRFTPWQGLGRAWPVAQQITLAQTWRKRTAVVDSYQNSVVETVVQALDRAPGNIHLQYCLTPLPTARYHAALRSHVHTEQRRARAAQQANPADPGLNAVDQQSLRNSLDLYGKSAWRVEIRLGADDWQTMQRVVGALAEANDENQLAPHTVVLGKRLWTRWFYQRVPSLGLFGASVWLSAPLATLIHLPSARLRVNSLHRQLVRRGPAPKGVQRTPDLALVRDEFGPVGIWEADRKFNILEIGSQGSGKTTDLLNLLKVDGRWRDARGRPKAVVLIDIGKDTAHRALGIIPPDREVLWVDPGDPACPWYLNPLASSVSESAIANDVLEALTQVFGEEAIRARSREFLGNAILALRDVFGEAADFGGMYRLLTDEGFRMQVIQRVQDPHQRAYWQQTFLGLMESNPHFLEEGLAAPRNKLDEVLRNTAVRAFLTPTPGRRALDLRRVVQGCQVLLLNLDKSTLGKAGARLLGVFAITLLWHVLEGQTATPEAERVPVSLVIDEAQNFLAEGFLDLLAEGRAFGLQTTVAVRFLGEIASEKVIQGLQALAQNLVVHQFELLSEAEIFMKRFMRVFANMITTADESQDALNFGADDFMRLPKFHAVCRYMVHGQPAPAFLTQTMPWEEAYDERVRELHLARQPGVRPGPEEPAEAGPARETAGTPMAAPDAPAPTSGGTGSDPAPPPGARPLVPEAGRAALELLVGPEAAASWLAQARDPLTGCYTQAVCQRLLDQPATGCVVVAVDLDGLKAINDREGHEAGNAYQARAGAALRKVARAGDCVGRNGGDEFVWIAPGGDPQELVARLRQAFRKAQVAASVGAVAQAPDESLRAALNRADQALYADKRRRKRGPAHAAAPPLAASELLPAFAARYGVSAEALEALAREFAASDADLLAAVRWVLAHDVPREAGRARLVRLLELKREDRLLAPLCKRLGADRAQVRDAIVAAGCTVAEALAVWEAHPDLETLEAFRAALAAGHRMSV
ncbi:MAG: GGDEF domain-containing protein [Firmicutes bacterium]|nr:GGDEF domain-containing protein [Bacillota bacterium]